MKLGLGTVQLGMDYGVANDTGRPDTDQARRILEFAVGAGMACFDTAPAYGDSEPILGRFLPDDPGLRIVTKTPVVRDLNRARIDRSFERSCELLRRERVYGLLVHAADDLLGPGAQEVYDTISELKARGVVSKIGVSVYDDENLERLTDRFALDLVQLPVSVLDQRALRSGTLSSLKRRGVEIHARSAFLQGLLLMDSEALPTYFDPVREHLRSYRAYIGERGWSPLEAALGFLKARDEIDSIICGVETVEQLRQIHESYRTSSVDAGLLDFRIDDPRILNPSLWTV